MPKIKYISKNFRADSLKRIEQANEIIAEYQAQGYDLTLRQLYYQFVSRDLIPNNQKSYDNLGALISDARLAGLIDWDAIQDRTRNLRENPHWASPNELVSVCANQFAIDRWATQSYRPEVWIEKDALVGVIENICTSLQVPYFSCRGYTSQSEMWGAGQRMRRHLRRGQTPLVIHFGDHDPSGIDMTRDIQDRLEMFTDERIEVRRVALNMDQIIELGAPPNPAKLTDSRADDYIAKYGYESWELDALEPKTFEVLVQTAVDSILDQKKWKAACTDEKNGRKELSLVANDWSTAVESVK